MGYTGGSLTDLVPSPASMDDAAKRTAQRVGELLQERVTEHTPVAQPPPGHYAEWLASRHGRLPGTLKESWKVGDVTVSQAAHTYSIDVYTMDKIAPYVEWPTLPHLIVPRRPGGMLRFWDKLGNTIYATIVHHTGTKGSYMMATAIAEVALLWEAIGAEEMQAWAREQQALI